MKDTSPKAPDLFLVVKAQQTDKKNRVFNQTSDSQNCHPIVRENKVLMEPNNLPKDDNPTEHIHFGFLNLKLHLNYNGQPILAVKKN